MIGKNKRRAHGFTLVESMVTVAIFSMLIVSATNIFLSIIRSQRNTLASKNAQEAVSYALEVMTKELRMAKVDDGQCGSDLYRKIYAVSTSSDQIRFRNDQNICVTYLLKQDDTSVPGQSIGRLQIKRDDKEAYMTPANIEISQLSFNARHLDDIDTEQPLITIRFVLSYQNSETGWQSLNVQTSVSSRSYENYEQDS